LEKHHVKSKNRIFYAHPHRVIFCVIGDLFIQPRCVFARPYLKESNMSFIEELEDLESAEDFLQYFQLDYEQSVVHVNRLHILQRFHDYLQKAADSMPEDETAMKAVYAKLLQRAYQDFVESDAQTEKVFKVFNSGIGEAQTAFVSLSEIKT
jgi:nitrogenase-stabilizing/protective protein